MKHGLYDPIPKMRMLLNGMGLTEGEVNQLETAANERVALDFTKAQAAAEPDIKTVEEASSLTFQL